jgi:hypothetical protein
MNRFLSWSFFLFFLFLREFVKIIDTLSRRTEPEVSHTTEILDFVNI